MPKSVVYFDVVGTTGDHRIITLESGRNPDSATAQVFATWAAACRGDSTWQ